MEENDDCVIKLYVFCVFCGEKGFEGSTKNICLEIKHFSLQFTRTASAFVASLLWW
jgi:hypothetical protein